VKTLTDPDNILQTYVGRTQSQISVLKFWRPRPKGPKMAVKRWEFFCNWYNELAFLCNGTDWLDIREKTSIGVLYWTEEFWKFSLKECFCHKTTILGCIYWSPCTGLQFGVTFL